MFVCRLKDVLEERGLKQKFIAEKLSMSRNTISAIVNGSKTDIESALKIAQALGLQVEDIWTLREDEK